MSARLWPTALLVLLLGASAGATRSAAASSQEAIGIFFDDGCSICSATMLPGEQRTLEIRAIRGGSTGAFDLTGAHFAVTGLPPEWTVECIPNPTATFAFGDPFGEGASLLFPCVSGSCVLLYRCTLTATTVATVSLRPGPHANPQGCPGGCACIAYCAPSPTAACASAREAIINGTDACTVGVQPFAWSHVKRLFD